MLALSIALGPEMQQCIFCLRKQIQSDSKMWVLPATLDYFCQVHEGRAFYTFHPALKLAALRKEIEID